MSKQTIGVLYGGQSGEHEVSCVSAGNIIDRIDKEKYNILPIGITKEGTWNIYTGSTDKIKSGEWKSDKENLKENIDILNDLKDIDLFFPVLHGPMGEDGTIQGVFEVLNKPYVGCGVLASSVGMDKILSKITFEKAGVPTNDYILITRKEFNDDPESVMNELIEVLGFPEFIKPANLGSSVGISKVNNIEELKEALDLAFEYDRRVIAEEFIKGREIECAVLEEDGNIQTARPGEIKPGADYYDYDAKYNSNGASVSIIPADIPDEALDKIEEYAKEAFKALDGSGFARVDFFYNDETGEIWINEVNTIPGFTPISMYPMMWENSGIPYDELVQRLINTAENKKTFKFL